LGYSVGGPSTSTDAASRCVRNAVAVAVAVAVRVCVSVSVSALVSVSASPRVHTCVKREREHKKSPIRQKEPCYNVHTCVKREREHSPAQEHK